MFRSAMALQSVLPARVLDERNSGSPAGASFGFAMNGVMRCCSIPAAQAYPECVTSVQFRRKGVGEPEIARRIYLICAVSVYLAWVFCAHLYRLMMREQLLRPSATLLASIQRERCLFLSSLAGRIAPDFLSPSFSISALRPTHTLSYQ